MSAIMINTRYDPQTRFRNATGSVAVDLLVPPSSQYPSAVGIYVRRGYSSFIVGQSLTYEKDNIKISGPIERIEDIPGQSFLVYVVSYNGTAITSQLTGGTVYPTPAGSGTVTDPTSGAPVATTGLAASLKKYAPFIAVGAVALIGGVIWFIKKRKK
jgi:hypothetical protein